MLSGHPTVHDHPQMDQLGQFNLPYNSYRKWGVLGHVLNDRAGSRYQSLPTSKLRPAVANEAFWSFNTGILNHLQWPWPDWRQSLELPRFEPAHAMAAWKLRCDKFYCQRTNINWLSVEI